MDNASATTVDPAGDGDEDFEKHDDTHDSSNEDDESEYEPDDEEVGHGEDAEEDGNDEGGEIGGGGEEEEGDEEDEGGEEEEEEEDEEEDYSQTADWPCKCTDCSKFFVGIGARNGAGIATYEGKPSFHFFFYFGGLFHHPLPDFMLFPFFLFVLYLKFCFCSNPGGYSYYFSALGKPSASLRCREAKATGPATPSKDTAAAAKGRSSRKKKRSGKTDTRCARMCHSLGAATASSAYFRQCRILK